MEIFDGHRALLRPLSGPAVAIGNFDGVHRGHQELLGRAVAAARRLGGDAVCFTFEPHPARVLAPQLAPQLITSRDRKLELVEAAGIDVAVLEPFTRELASLSPDAFLRDIMVEVLGARHIVVGYDFTYGRKRSGSTEMLRAFGDQHGFTTEVVAAVEVDGIVASSTKVRNFISAGNMAGARLLLGRDFDVDGTVVRGDARGRQIGFPTANLRTAAELLPPSGVYAVRARLLDEAGGWLPGVANLGTRPTFEAGPSLTLEVHLFDFERDIYDRPLRVAFADKLRNERRFSGVDELVAQIRADAARAREILVSGDGS